MLQLIYVHLFRFILNIYFDLKLIKDQLFKQILKV